MKVAAINKSTREIEMKEVPVDFVPCHVSGDYYPKEEVVSDFGHGFNQFIALAVKGLPEEEKVALKKDTTELKRTLKFRKLSQRTNLLNEIKLGGVTVKVLQDYLSTLKDDDIVVIQAAESPFGCNNRSRELGWFEMAQFEDAELSNVHIIGKA